MLGMRGVDLGLHGDDLGLNGDLLCSDGRHRERDLSRGGECVWRRLPPSLVWPRTTSGGGSVSFPDTPDLVFNKLTLKATTRTMLLDISPAAHS